MPSLARPIATALMTLAVVAAFSASAVAQGSAGPRVAVPTLITPAAAGGCAPGWLDTFASQPGVDGQVLDMVEFDDGNGPALYVAGSFESAGAVAAPSVARWDGSAWSAVGAGLEGFARRLLVFDDGNGPALYAAGGFSASGGTPMRNVARWDGSAWTGLATSMSSNSLAYCLAEHAGSLYLGGNFTSIDGLPRAHVARWTGSGWDPLGAGTPSAAYSMLSHDDGSGQALFVSGVWDDEPGFPYDHLARWNGSTWSDVGGGLPTLAWAMAEYDSGGGPTLHVSGPFSTAGSGAVPVAGVASWDGGTWSAPFVPSTSGVEDMVVRDLGSGPELFMAGTILDGVASWNGSTLTSLGAPGPFVDCVEVFDTGGGPQLACGGGFHDGNNAPGLSRVAVRTAGAWETMGDPGFGGEVQALFSYDDGSGPALWVGGQFGDAYGVPGKGFARWKDGAWDDLGGTQGPIVDFVAFNDGSGMALYACGQVKPGGSATWDVARWNGSSWSLVGDVSAFGASVIDLHVHDDGGGAALYAAGTFPAMSGVAAANIARWDGSVWTPVGSGPGGTVLTMASYDDGTGNQLYVGGTFHTGIGGAGDYVARWDGATWSSLGGGPDVGSGHAVRALQVFDHFGEKHLYVGGSFDDVNGIPFTEGLARFDATGWSELPFAGFTGEVRSLAVYLDGNFPAPALVVGGDFDGLGLFDARDVMAWTGFGWTTFTHGVAGRVSALAVHDANDGLGPVLMVGGDFTYQVGDPAGDARLARWGGCWAGVDNWTDLGFALAGTFGDPLLVGTGSLAPASYNTVSLSNAFPSSLSALFISFSSTPIPFMGGTLVPNPFIDPPVFATTSPLGTLPLHVVMPGGVPAGTQLFVQWAITDVAAVSGVSMSNAIRGDVP